MLEVPCDRIAPGPLTTGHAAAEELGKPGGVCGAWSLAAPGSGSRNQAGFAFGRTECSFSLGSQVLLYSKLSMKCSSHLMQPDLRPS